MGELRTLRDKQMAINLQLEELTGVLTRVKGMLERLNLAEIENLKRQQKKMEEGREDSWESLKEISSNFNETFKKIREIDSELLKLQVEYKKKQMVKSNIGITLKNLGEIWKYQLAEYTYYILLVEAIRYLLVPEKTQFKEGLRTFLKWDLLGYPKEISSILTPDNMKKWIYELSKNLQPFLLKLLENEDYSKVFSYSDDDKKLINDISLLKGILAPEEQYQFLEAKMIRNIKDVIDAKMKILTDNRIANKLSAFEPTIKPILEEEKVPETAPIEPESSRIVVPIKPPRLVPKLEPSVPKLEQISERPVRVDDKPWLKIEKVGEEVREKPYGLRRRTEEDIYDISRYEKPIRREEVIRDEISRVKDRLPLIIIEKSI